MASNKSDSCQPAGTTSMPSVGVSGVPGEPKIVAVVLSVGAVRNVSDTPVT